MSDARDTIDLSEVLTALRRRWRWIAGGAAAGVAVALLLVVLLPPRYDAATTVLVREHPEIAGLASGSTGGSVRGGGGGGGGGLFSGLSSILSIDGMIDTEVEIMTSRTVIGAVVDSLGLQVDVRSPRDVPVRALFTAVDLRPDLDRTVLRFRRTADGYRVRGGADSVVAQGGTVRLAAGTLTLAGDAPDRFRIELRDRREAIREVRRALDTDNLSSELVELDYSAGDRWTAAAVPNAIVSEYLARRETVDRGLNRRRYEFLSAHTDSVRAELARSEAMLREHQEATGVFDPRMTGEAEIEQALALRERLETVEVEARALDEVLARVADGTFSVREIAGYPTLLTNPAINNLLSRLHELETRQVGLLDRRTEADPEVRVTAESIEAMERQLASLVGSYRAGLAGQEREIRRELARYRSALDALPANAEEAFRRQREVERLSETLVALQSSLVHARLAALGEGGDVRQVDEAHLPFRREFPRLPIFLVLGLAVGLVGGTIGALGRTYLADRVRDARDVRETLGLPAVDLPGVPVLPMVASSGVRGIVVAPLEAGGPGRRVALLAARTAAARGRSTAIADLSAEETPLLTGGAEGNGDGSPPSGSPTGPGASLVRYERRRSDGAAELRDAVEGLERDHENVVVLLEDWSDPATFALLDPGRLLVLVVEADRGSRSALRSAAEVAVGMTGERPWVVVWHAGKDGDLGGRA